MNKKLIVPCALVAALMMGGTFTANAFVGPMDDCGDAPPPAGKKMDPERHFARMAKELKLTDAQKEQIKAILKGEREQMKPQREKMAANRNKLRDASEAATFDEAAVKAIAADQAAILQEMIVARARVHSQINALLTPEQRELAKKLHPFKDGKRGKRRGM
ncbi:MAG TPA: Spy/CpxP family protein refolding chaperone [Geobacteraceae bacterium]